jgi:hypothetical protein
MVDELKLYDFCIAEMNANLSMVKHTKKHIIRGNEKSDQNTTQHPHPHAYRCFIQG